MSTTDTTKLKQINIVKGGVTSSLGMLKVGSNVVWRREQTITFAATTYGSWGNTTLTIPFGATYSTNGTTITFKIGDTTVGTNTLTMPNNTTATSSSTTGYTYNYSIDKTSGTVSNNFTITSTGSRTASSYWVTFARNNSSYGSLSSYGAAVPANATVSVSSNILRFNSTNYSTPTAEPASAMSDTEYANNYQSKRTVSWTRTYLIGSWSKTSGTITSPQTITHNFTYSDGTKSYTTWLHSITLVHPGTFTVTNSYGGSSMAASTGGGLRLLDSSGTVKAVVVTKTTGLSWWLTEGQTYTIQGYTSTSFFNNVKPSVGYTIDNGSKKHLSGPIDTSSSTTWRGSKTITIDGPHTLTLCGGTEGSCFSYATASYSNSSNIKSGDYSPGWSVSLPSVTGYASATMTWNSTTKYLTSTNGNASGAQTGSVGGWTGGFQVSGYNGSTITFHFYKASGSQVRGYPLSASATFYRFCP